MSLAPRFFEVLAERLIDLSKICPPRSGSVSLYAASPLAAEAERHGLMCELIDGLMSESEIASIKMNAAMHIASGAVKTDASGDDGGRALSVWFFARFNGASRCRSSDTGHGARRCIGFRHRPYLEDGGRMTGVSELLHQLRPPISAERSGERRRLGPADATTHFYKSLCFCKKQNILMKTLPRPLRCACCGATAKDEQLVVDHVIPLRLPNDSLNPDGWAKRMTGPFQILCNEHNFICKGRQDDDWRDNVSATQPGQTNK